ncbi:Nn.00g073680.m01.CDS01 [Neocucurbitaria sp. VM-36]
MSDLAIPCTQPSTTVPQINARDVIRITVGKGSNVVEYGLNADALSQRSGYFREKLRENDEHVKQRPLIALPDEIPAVFDVFVLWMHRGIVARKYNSPFDFLCQLFIFATKLDIPLMRNAIVDAFIETIYSLNSLPYDVTRYLERYARDSALRNMVIDVVLNCGEMEEVARSEISLAKGFFKKSVFADGAVVPFRMSSDVRGYLRWLKDHACEMYHEHPTGDEMGVEQEIFFFDPPLEG